MDDPKVKALEEMVREYRAAREDLNLFDSACWLGIPLKPEFEVCPDPASTFRSLEKRGVRRGVFAHILALHYDPVHGNRVALDAVSKRPGSYASAVLVPDLLPGKKLKSYVADLVRSGVRTARMYPASHKFPFSDWMVRDVITVLAEFRLPLVLAQTEVSWDLVRRLCQEYRDLPVIIEGGEQKLFYHNRVYHRLLEELPNLYVGTHAIVSYLDMEAIVARLGASRLIFGTYFPHQDPNVSIMPLTHSPFSQRERRKIAHANLEYLIGRVVIP